MTDLTADVNDNQVYWKVSDMPVADYLQADDEIVRIIYRLAQHEEVYVERGYAGTTAASHSSGELTTLWVPGTGGGAEQSVSLLGPFHIAHDTPDLFSGTPIELVEVPQAAWVEVRAVITEFWDGGGDETGVDASFRLTDPGENAFSVKDFWNSSIASTISGFAASGLEGFADGPVLVRTPDATVTVSVSVQGPGESPTIAGEADVYVIVTASA
jgi:hypothetical protein